MTNRVVMLTLVAVLAIATLFFNPSGVYAAEPTKPNFVVILIDDMGYGDIGPFGSKVNRTPNLDRMAEEGMKLTSFYAAPVCTPSRAQMMAGCYAKRVSMPNVIFPSCPTGLSTKEKTVARLLKDRGYATMCIGKWHLGDQPEFLPTKHGFDHYVSVVEDLTAEAGCQACNISERNSMKPCPGCVKAYWMSNGETRIRYIPQFLELCSDCSDPGERALKEKEQEQFHAFVKKVRAEKNERDRIARRPYQDEQNLKRRNFYKMVVKKKV